jgi:acyl-CoA dehydrogenase
MANAAQETNSSNKRGAIVNTQTAEASLDLPDLVQGVRSFLEAEVVPRHERHQRLLSDPSLLYDGGGRQAADVTALAREIRELSSQAGYYTMFVPAELGGGGQGYEALYTVWEAIFQFCGSQLWLGHEIVAHWTRGPSGLLRMFTPEVRGRVLPDLMSGRATMCFAMSEPEAGSDVRMMRTSASRGPAGSGWSLSGTKQWITNAAHASYAIVFAVTDPEAARARTGGFTAFLVPTDSKGFDVGEIIRQFGSAGGDEATITLTDVQVPDENVIGEVNAGFDIALEGIALGRLFNCAKSVGLAAWGLKQAVSYTRGRKAFGHALSEYQGVTFPLADSLADIHAARLMSLDCARRLDQIGSAPLELAMAKSFATERCAQALDRIMQAHGAMGFTNELGIADAWQRVRRVCVADGSTEVLRRQIVKHLYRGESGL